MPWGLEYPASWPAGVKRATCSSEVWFVYRYPASSWTREVPGRTRSAAVWYTSRAPDQMTSFGWRLRTDGSSVTCPFATRNGSRPRVVAVTWTALVEVFVSDTVLMTAAEGCPERSSCPALTRSPPGAEARVVPGIDSASRTAAPTSRSPAPCWSAGACTSLAVLVRISFTTAGLGVVPWCDARYASMTSAAAPAVSGEDSLVPPVSWKGSPAQSWYAGEAEHSAQLRSPGATRSTVLPSCATPPDDSAEMLSSRYRSCCPGRLMPPK